MPSSIKSGNNTTGLANVDSNYNLNVVTPTTEIDAGFVQLSSERDAGTVTGSRIVKALECSDDYRLRVGMDTPLFSLSFEGSNIAQDRIAQSVTTMTISQSSGIITLNNAATTTTTTSALITTWRYFSLYASYPLFVEYWLREANQTATNAISEWGWATMTASNSINDGAVFRRDGSGALLGVLKNNSTETNGIIDVTNLKSRDGVTAFDPTAINHYLIEINLDRAKFWINNTLVLTIEIPSSQPFPAQASAQPMCARVYNSGAASAGRRLEIGFMGCSQGDANTGKPWSHIMCGNGGASYNIQPGTASGSTVTRGAATTGWPTSATARAAGTWTANTAPAQNSLGGIWISGPMTGVVTETDYPIFSYLNIAGTAVLPGKNLYITGVRVGEAYVTAAAAAGGMLFNYIIGVNSSGSTLATSESATSTAPRGLVIGGHGFLATEAVGNYKPGFEVTFNSPLVIAPGCYFHFIIRPAGTTALNTLAVTGSLLVNGYFE